METIFSTQVTISTDEILDNLSDFELDELVTDCLHEKYNQEKRTRKAIFEDYLGKADDDILVDELKNRGFTDLER